MLKQLSRTFTDIPFNNMLGLELAHLDANFVTLRFNMKPELIGNFLHGILHGGVISSVLDMAGGMATMATAIHQNPDATLEDLTTILGKCSTIALQINYLRPGRGEFFLAKARLIKAGKKISFTRMELTNQDDTLIAMGSGTYSLSTSAKKSHRD